ncbi:amino acid adenylation domain-containing protein [Micromonospora sp. WMMD723]|uniref:amino acid adenylation domain-containing protein n=1 Tax=Micromonospora sp. WMMD723 TaxID=3403465 RepID=UPI003CF02B85
MRLHDLLGVAAQRRPDAVAVVDDGGPTSYGELAGLADRYAAGLRERGTGPGDRVVIWAGKTVETVALMQAVLRVGGIYVPVSPTNPASRVSLIAKDADAALVVTGPHQAADAGEITLAGRAVAEGPELLRDAADGTPPHDSAADDPAYILYTSGSTGTPKGVCISHRNALAFVGWATRTVGVGPGDRLSNHAPFNFDLSVFDLYAAFAAGASVHLVPAGSAYSPEQLTAFLRERRITVWYSVPSALTLMMRDGDLLRGGPPPDLRACIFAGEVFPLPDLARLRRAWPTVRFWNWYGPTETNVCTSYEVTGLDVDVERPLPIGTASAGNEVRIVDPAGDGTGEIVVTGPTVMLGYWGRPPQQGAYHTGDLGRQDADGLLHYVGRRDQQVKVRGHRIELGEIENAIATLPGVEEVAVVACGDGLDRALHAFVVPASGVRLSSLDVRRWCAERLPSYMIIDRLHAVEALPRTANGKVDRRSLGSRPDLGGKS